MKMIKWGDRRRFLQAAAAGGLVVPAASAAVGGPMEAGQWGDLVGQLLYDGPPPARKKLKVDKDVDCCGKFDIRDESLIVDAKGGLANVFVYVRTKGVKICPELHQSASDKVTLDNRDCIFKPHCMTIWYTRQTFEIVNSDPVGQNVAFTPILDLPVNVVLPVDGKVTHRFGRSQTVPVKIVCNYHPWESGYVLPKDHPYAAVSQTNGTFRIKKLPVGELEFQVWHERVGYLSTGSWPRGRFKMSVHPGVNDLGVIRLPPDLFRS
jgi:hypothetical protein